MHWCVRKHVFELIFYTVKCFSCANYSILSWLWMTKTLGQPSVLTGTHSLSHTNLSKLLDSKTVNSFFLYQTLFTFHKRSMLYRNGGCMWKSNSHDHSLNGSNVITEKPTTKKQIWKLEVWNTVDTRVCIRIVIEWRILRIPPCYSSIRYPLSGLVQIRIDTDILRNGIRLVRLKSAEVL